MDLKPFHGRLAELWQKSKTLGGKLTVAESKELGQCLDLHAAFMYEQAKLFNLSLAASMVDDTEWQHEICARLDKS